MTGVCRGCGQIQEVAARTQEEADEFATMNCNCGEGEKIRKKAQLMESIQIICGPPSVDKGFNPIDPKTIERIKEAASLVFDNKIDKATFSVENSLVMIKKNAKKVTCSRRRSVEIAEEVTA